jgi:hypothetical protein
LTNGANYGDDYQSSTNYPIIAVVNNATGHVFYAETYDWTVSVAPGAPGSTNFILPIAESGASQLFVIANGVQSSPVSVSVTAGISPDGSTITPGTGGSLVTAAGTWTFGPCCDPYGQGQYKILLNGGTAWPAGQGYAAKMEVANGGKLYTYNSYVHGWWIWTGSAWSNSAAPSANGAISPDGTILTAPSNASLTTAAGVWTFGPCCDPYGQGQYQILLNGGTAWPAGQGYAAKMEVANEGTLYTYNSFVDGWWIWIGSAWSNSAGP